MESFTQKFKFCKFNYLFTPKSFQTDKESILHFCAWVYNDSFFVLG